MNNINKKISSPSKYFNRELSWLAFNNRVLDQAFSDNYPILERIRFLSFVCSNLDQFYEIRVAGLQQKVDGGSTKCGFDGIPPTVLLDKIRDEAAQMALDKQTCWKDVLRPTLKRNKIFFKKIEELSKEEFIWVRSYFRREVFPILTPLAVDPTHPFPLILNKSLNIIVSLKKRRKKKADCLMAIVPIPRILPRLVKLKARSSKENSFLFLSDMVRYFADDLFPGHIASGAWAFRITRNSHLYVDEEEVENLLQSIEEELHNLKKGSAVRLEIDDGVEDGVLKYLLDAISLSEKDVIRVNGPINLYRLMSLPDQVDRPDLKFPPFEAYLPKEFEDKTKIFEALKNKDILLHHPYDSFLPVVDFLKLSATDPAVFAIKLTIYRTNGNSPIVKALMDAARNGKQVTALVELKARFDEEANVQWAHKMEEVGVHVVYGLPGLKTHSKCCLVVRREGSKLKSYAHLGTGNYNPSTAKTYTDYSLFTSKLSYTSDLGNLFNTLTGYSRTPRFKKLLIAPYILHSRTIGLIEQESLASKAGETGKIIIKVNSLIPHLLSRFCGENNSRLIHISTDGVFSGKKGNYKEVDIPDPLDFYARSKLLGEVYNENALTIRTSIIGPEINTSKGLLEWFKSCKEVVYGYSNVWFSGFPTIELSRIILKFIIKKDIKNDIYNLSSKPINKFNLLKKINNIYGLNKKILEDESLRIDRTLDCSKFISETQFVKKEWDFMINRMKEFN